LAGAAAAALIFLLSLHPSTGLLGGIIFLLLGWALPTLFDILLALGLAYLLPANLAARAMLALVLWFGLAGNSSLPLLFHVFSYSPSFAVEIIRVVSWTDNPRFNTMDVKHQPWAPIFVHPFGPRVRVGGDEGCGCFYFLEPKAELYSDLVVDTIFQIVGKRGAVVEYQKIGNPAREMEDRHIDLNFWQQESGFSAIIEVFDHGTRIAVFRHSGIPLHALVQPTGIGRDKFSENFTMNALDLFLHDNLWTAMMNGVAPVYFPTRKLSTFFIEALGPFPRPQ
jgi:hypothetical protein